MESDTLDALERSSDMHSYLYRRKYIYIYIYIYKYTIYEYRLCIYIYVYMCVYILYYITLYHNIYNIRVLPHILVGTVPDIPNIFNILTNIGHRFGLQADLDEILRHHFA